MQNIDLHALTGWIPERTAIRKDSPDFNSDAVFDLLKNNLERGCLLATVATGELSDSESERTGLVPTHAYALLNIRVVNVSPLVILNNFILFISIFSVKRSFIIFRILNCYNLKIHGHI